MLKTEGLTKIYASKSFPAVNNLELHIRKGEIFGFLGPNGAGKSTTIKMITGILQPTTGRVIVDGIDMTVDPIGAKKQIGYVSDDHATYDRLTGSEYLSFVSRIYDVAPSIAEGKTAEYAEMFGLTEVLGNQISSYSHGMKQKIAIMAAIIHNPRLWVLDEPLTGLDPQSAYDLKHIMRMYADEGNTVFFSSHVIDVVEKVCDRVGIIADGSLVKVATIDELKREYPDRSLETIFLDLTSGNRY